MSQTMRERLARAICRARALDPDAPGDEPPKPNWMDFLDDVDAVLAELREPDDDMKDAEYAARRKPLRSNQDFRYRTFTAMIDAVRSSR